MAFRVPTFNLSANICTWVAVPVFPLAARLTVPAQLRMLKTAEEVNAIVTNHSTVALMVQKLTDVRMATAGGVGGDYVEVPAGTGRWYQVVAVDDVAKGFTNEYRMAVCQSTNQHVGTWPFPYP